MAQRYPRRGLALWLTAGAAAIAGTAYVSFGLGSSGNDKEAVPQNDSEANCADNWTMCRDSADLVNYSPKAGEARRACIAAVNETAKNGHPKWCSGWMCEDFPNYQTGTDSADDGLLTLIDNHIQMPGKSGAWVHSTAYCTYNIRTQKVVALNIGAN